MPLFSLNWFIFTDYDAGDNQLRVQGHLSTRLVDTDGQGQAPAARQGDVPQEGKVSGALSFVFVHRLVLNVATFQVPGQARVSQNRIKVNLSHIFLKIDTLNTF